MSFYRFLGTLSRFRESDSSLEQRRPPEAAGGHQIDPRNAYLKYEMRICFFMVYPDTKTFEVVVLNIQASI